MLDVHEELKARRDNPSSVNGWFKHLATIIKERRYKLEDSIYGDGAKLIAPTEFVVEYTSALEWSQFALALAEHTHKKKEKEWGKDKAREIESCLDDMGKELKELRKLVEVFALANASIQPQQGDGEGRSAVT